MKAVLQSVGALDNQATIHQLPSPEKKVFHIGMIHLAKKEFYTDVGIKVDSLSKQNYFVYFEIYLTMNLTIKLRAT